MKYLALIYTDEKLETAASPEQQQTVLNDYLAYNAWLAEKPGKNLAAEALLPTTTAKTLRVRNGKTTITDGPFAETKEHLGGFYMYEAKDIDEALELASRIPGAKVGCIEVRPIMVFDG